MKTYLAAIAARNNITGNQAVMPALSPPLTPEPDADQMDVVEDWSVNNQPKGAGLLQNQGINYDPLEQVHTNIMRPDPGKAALESEPKVQYIAKHIERIRYEEKIAEQHSLPSSSLPLPKTQLSSIEIPIDQADSRFPLNPQLNDQIRQINVPAFQGEEHDTLPRIIPLDVTTTSHAPDLQHDDLTENRPSPIVPVPGRKPLKSSPERQTVQEIMPRIPELISQDKQRSTAESKKQTVPKLTIGKITVEIVSPPASQPQKVITRIVQKPADDNNGRMNRLGIGLGQL